MCNETDEERDDLLSSARTIDALIKCMKHFPGMLKGSFAKLEGLKYDFINEGSCFSNDVLSDGFRHLNQIHLSSKRHEMKCKEMKEKVEKNKILNEAGKQIAVNCAAAAYLTYKLDASYKNYESVIAEFHNCGVTVGQKNHSKEFPRMFLPHIYSTLRKTISSYIINENLPIGIIADKMTVNHRTRHIVGIRIPICNINHPSLFTSIYIEHHFCSDVSGEGLCESILNALEKFGINLTYLRNNLIGIAMDGQYIQLGVVEHLKRKLVREDIPISWDPMHRVELMQTHTKNVAIFQDAVALINSCMKEFMWGKSFELLLECSEEVNASFLKPKVFKTLKFVSHSRDVFHTFISDYSSLVAACEKSENDSLRDKLLCKKNIFNILIFSDIISVLALISECVQQSDLLPFEYERYIKNLKSYLQIMKYELAEMANSESTDGI